MNREQINKALETAHEALSYAALSATNSKDAEYYKDAEKEVFAALSAPKSEAETLPCDVQIPGALFCKGVSMEVFMFALKRREGWSEEDTRLRAAPKAEAKEPCPVCEKPFVAGDTCATDIELGKCHAECLAGSPTVDLETGEPVDGPIGTFPHDAPKAEAVERVARAWASIDGKLVEFEDERKSGCSLMEEDTGTYEGYMTDAAELLRRSDLLAAFPSKGEGE